MSVHLVSMNDLSKH